MNTGNQGLRKEPCLTSEAQQVRGNETNGVLRHGYRLVILQQIAILCNRRAVYLFIPDPYGITQDVYLWKVVQKAVGSTIHKVSVNLLTPDNPARPVRLL